MTSEPDGTPHRRPPTIDLTVTEVAAEKPASTQETGKADPTGQESSPGKQSGGPSAATPRSTLKAAAAGAAVGAIAIGAIIAGLWFAGFVPSPQLPSSPAPSAQNAPAPNTAAVDEISAQLKKIEGSIQAQQPEQALGSRMAAMEAATKSLGDSLAALNRRVDDVAAAAQNALLQAKSAAAAAETAKSATQSGVTRGDLDALANRIAALESSMKALAADAAHRTTGADDRAARLTVATEVLRAAVERGAPFQAELTAVKSLGVDQNATAPLEPFAAAGVPSAAALAHELSALTPALEQASDPSPNDATFLRRLETNAQKLVRVTPVDAPAGDDPVSVAARINADAAHDDIAAALADIAKLPDTAKALTASWVQKAEARDAAIAAARRITADALAALGKPNTQ